MHGFVPSAQDMANGITSTDLSDFHAHDMEMREGAPVNPLQSVLPGIVAPGLTITPEQMLVLQDPDRFGPLSQQRQQVRAQQLQERQEQYEREQRLASRAARAEARAEARGEFTKGTKGKSGELGKRDSFHG